MAARTVPGRTATDDLSPHHWHADCKLFLAAVIVSYRDVCVCQPTDAADKRPIYRRCFATEFSRTSAPLRGGNSKPPLGISGLSLAWKKNLSRCCVRSLSPPPYRASLFLFFLFLLLLLLLDFLPRFDSTRFAWFGRNRVERERFRLARSRSPR